MDSRPALRPTQTGWTGWETGSTAPSAQGWGALTTTQTCTTLCLWTVPLSRTPETSALATQLCTRRVRIVQAAAESYSLFLQGMSCKSGRQRAVSLSLPSPSCFYAAALRACGGPSECRTVARWPELAEAAVLLQVRLCQAAACARSSPSRLGLV